MGVYTFTVADETTTVAPHRLFKAMVLDNHNLIPMAAPQIYKSAYFIEGDSTVVGSMKYFNFGEGVPFEYAKIKINELDVDNFRVNYTNFESDLLDKLMLECIVYDEKVVPTESGSQYKLVGHFHTKGDVVVTSEGLKTFFQVMVMTYKAVAQYLIDHPEVYA